MKKHILLCWYLILFNTLCFSQKKFNSKTYLVYLKQLEFNKAYTYLDSTDIKNHNLKVLRTYILILKDQDKIKQREIDLNKFESFDIFIKIISLLIKCNHEIYTNKIYIETFENLQFCLNESQKLRNKELTKLILLTFLDLYRRDYEQSNNDHKNYLNQYKLLTEDKHDLAYLALYNFIFESRSDEDVNQKFHDIALNMDNAFKNVSPNSKIYPFYLFEKGIYHKILGQNQISKRKFQATIANTTDDVYYRKINIGSYIKLSQIAFENKKVDSAFILLDKTKSYYNSSNPLDSDYFYNLYISKYYAYLSQFKSAYLSLKKSVEIRNNLNPQKSILNRTFLDVKYETAKKNELLKQQKILTEIQTDSKNMSIAIASLLILVILITSFSTLRNSKKRRLIALQEKQLATQKNLTLLKDQEIISINAMVAGQEKERKRVAEDLHDNLGSVIATLKMHFDNLRLNRELKKVDQETLFDKTEGLIEETYQKVRNMAHAKNAGVIANQGLLVAVKLMAEKISSANTLQIDVVDYGLEKPLENSLEITLFRFIQELTTNIIKHAKATMVTINISQDDEDITILIEDNGIGMDTSQIDLKKGMGIHSIKTRVEHLEGSFTIDSTPSKGTTIIINIPT